ncbi:MAG: DUF1559 domain-containing protein [Verrucomicrobia bacterium]|nr:DUF1559 domain-containing protein [Verrucomicrobiota bacterium]
MRTRTRDGRIPPALVRITVVLVMLIALVPTAMSGLFGSREQARRASCLSNTKQLGLAMKQYSQDLREMYPWHVGATKPENAWLDLGILFPNYCSAFKVFFCPSAKDTPWDIRDKIDDDPLGPFESANNKQVISYAYGIDGTDKPTVPWTENARSTVRLLADKKAGIEITDETRRLANHHLDGRNVLYQDGHVKWTIGVQPLDPDEDDDKDGDPDADDYKAFWSDPPWYGEGMAEEENENESAE